MWLVATVLDSSVVDHRKVGKHAGSFYEAGRILIPKSDLSYTHIDTISCMNIAIKILKY